MDQPRLEQLLIDRQIAVPVYIRETTPSTNELLMQMELRPFGASYALSEHQSAGRGRQGRDFYSPLGGVYVSFAFQPKRRGRMPVTVAAAVAVCDAVEGICGVRPQIGWPNDILLEGRKLCGILAESYESGRRSAIVVGVGLNLNTDSFPPLLQDTAISLKQAFGREFDFEPAAAELMGALSDLPAAAGLVRGFQNARRSAESLARYSRDCGTLGKAVCFFREGLPVTGVAESLNEDGSLNLRLPDGSLFCQPFAKGGLSPALQIPDDPL